MGRDEDRRKAFLLLNVALGSLMAAVLLRFLGDGVAWAAVARVFFEILLIVFLALGLRKLLTAK